MNININFFLLSGMLSITFFQKFVSGRVLRVHNVFITILGIAVGDTLPLLIALINPNIALPLLSLRFFSCSGVKDHLNRYLKEKKSRAYIFSLYFDTVIRSTILLTLR